jgi:hypothetical protein
MRFALKDTSISLIKFKPYIDFEPGIARGDIGSPWQAAGGAGEILAGSRFLLLSSCRLC